MANADQSANTAEDGIIDAREDTSIGVVLLSAEGPSTKDGVYSFLQRW